MIVSSRSLRLFRCKGSMTGAQYPFAYFAENYTPRRKTMTTRITSLIHTSTTSILRLALLSSLVIATPLLFAGQHSSHAATQDPAGAVKLVKLVRQGTKQYVDVN